MSQTHAFDGSLVRGLVWTGAVKWASQLLSWLSTIVVARLLIPEDYGLVAMAGVLLGVISLFNEFGLGAAVVALRNITDDQITRIHGLASMFGAAGFLVSCLVAIPTGQFFGAPEVARIMMVMGVGLVLVSMRSVPTAVLEKELRFDLDLSWGPLACVYRNSEYGRGDVSIYTRYSSGHSPLRAIDW